MKKKQLAINIVANFFSVAVSLVVSLFLTPYLVRSIGKEAYSFVPLSNNFTSYITIITIALSSMTARFVTIHLHRDQIDEANEYYSTSFFANLAVGVVITVLCVVILVYLPNIINIPVEILSDVRWLFFFVLAAFIVGVITNVFSVGLFSANRVDLIGVTQILGTLARLVVIGIAFLFFKPKVWYIGLSIFVYIVVQDVLYYASAKKVTPQLVISFQKARFKKFKELISSGIWNSFIQLSTVLLTGLDLLIANIMLGPSAAGILAVAKTAPLALMLLTNVIPTAFNPHLTIQYARLKKEEFLAEMQFTLKVVAVLVGIPIAVFLAISPDFLRLWVPSVASGELAVLSYLTMLVMVGSFCVGPLVYLFTITNKLKWPSIVVMITGLLNIVVVLVLLKTTHLGLYAIAGVSSILEFTRYLVFVPLYAAHCIGTKPSDFYRTIFRSSFFLVLSTGVFFALKWVFPIHGWLVMMVEALLMVGLGLLLGYALVMNRRERQSFYANAKHFLMKHKASDKDA